MALSAFNSKKQSLAPDVESLIKHLTGFKEDDPNFTEVSKFMYSNLIFHNFPTVNTTTVKKSLQGIIEKFKVHGKKNRAKRLEELIDIYVQMTQATEHTERDLQWNMLLFLLKLAYKPTSLTDEELEAKQVKLEPKIQEEDINWAEYLKEGLEVDQSYHSTESDHEGCSSSKDEGKPTKVSREFCGGVGGTAASDLPGFGGVPYPALWRGAATAAATSVRSALRGSERSEHWLRNNVQHGWWLPGRNHGCEGLPKSRWRRWPAANVCRIWEENEARKRYPNESLFPATIMIECRVLKEVLWLLLNPCDSFFFKENDKGRFYVKHNTSFLSTIPASLRSNLSGLCPYFDAVKKLRNFEDEVYQREVGGDLPPQTLKAYCSALSFQLKSFTDTVLSVETRLDSQEETMTLVSVWHNLSTQLNRLRCLSDIHDQATAGWRMQPAWLVATRLLTVLYECLLEANEENQVQMCLDLFLASFSVYLHIIDVWLSDGRLDDWRSEFIVLRDDESGGLLLMPYEAQMRAAGLRPVSLLAQLVRVSEDAQRTMTVVARLNKQAELRALAHKGCLVKEFTQNIYNEIKRLNGYSDLGTNSEYFDISASSKSFLTAKSEVSATPKERNSQISRQDNSVKPMLYCKEPNKMGKGEGEEIPIYFKSVRRQALSDQVVKDACRNRPLMEQNFHLLMHPQSSFSSSIRTPLPTPSLSLSFSGTPVSENHHGVGLMPIYRVLEHQLGLVVARHRTASRLVTRALRDEHHLTRHLAVTRAVYFMESSPLAQHFYSYLFNEIAGGTWPSALSLTVQLQVLVEEEYPGFGHFFSVLVAKRPEGPTDKVHLALRCISLAYRPEWPINSVITQDTMESYNSVFRFLLHIKYAFWTLRNMRFADLAGSPNVLRVRHLNMLKLWMYHSTNVLHTYFMGLVLRRFSAPMDADVERAESADAIVEAHRKYLKEVNKHCLQEESEKRTLVEDNQEKKAKPKNMLVVFIMKLVRLCGDLALHWDSEGRGTLTVSALVTLRDRYLSAYRGLLHCLQALEVEPEATNYLDELRSEIVHSIPTAWTEI